MCVCPVEPWNWIFQWFCVFPPHIYTFKKKKALLHIISFIQYEKTGKVMITCLFKWLDKTLTHSCETCAWSKLLWWCLIVNWICVCSEFINTQHEITPKYHWFSILPDIFMATHVNLFKLFRIIGAQILSHFHGHMLRQYRQQQSFLRINNKLKILWLIY